MLLNYLLKIKSQASGVEYLKTRSSMRAKELGLTRTEESKMIRWDGWRNFTVEKVVKVIKQTQNWRSPGPAKIKDYCFKQLTVLHEYLARTLNDIMNDTRGTPAL